MSGPDQVDPEVLSRWSETLAGIARTGLGFSQSPYERERFEEVLRVAAEVRQAAEGRRPAHPRAESLMGSWMSSVQAGVAGYVTPKVTVGAIVGNDAGEILLVQRSDSASWLFPTGWADVGYSASEVAVKEVREETGILAEPVRLVAVLDGLRLGFTSVALYSLLFHCRAVGGSLAAHPHECLDVGFFARDAMPEPLAGHGQWVEQSFRAIDGEAMDVVFDPPRTGT